MSTLTLPAGVQARNGAPVQSFRTARIALLGCGTVGREVARALIDDGDRIGAATGLRLDLTGILVRDLSRDRGFARKLFTTSLEELLGSKPDIVIEVLGGIEPAADHVEKALRRGLPVITANKSLIARHGCLLSAIAAEHGTTLTYEASVGAAIPVLAALRQLSGDRVRSIHAVINGTCNFILTRMTATGQTLTDALEDAKRLGLAEPDPTADISGLDSAEKLCVLAAAIGRAATMSQVQTDGIANVTAADVAAARSHGCVIKLIAELTIDPRDEMALRVAPMLVPRRHPLALAQGAQNAIVIDSEMGGTLVLQGMGAGPRATTSAILGDVIKALTGEVTPPFASLKKAKQGCRSVPRRHLVRIEQTRCAAPPDRVLSTLRDHSIDALHFEFRTDCVEIITRQTLLNQIEPVAIALCDHPTDRVTIMPMLE